MTHTENVDPAAIKALELDVWNKLIRLGQVLRDKYDLSPEAARAACLDTPGFRPHKILGFYKGKEIAKVGGFQRSGKARIDRYISYRMHNTIALLNFNLIKGGSASQGRWSVWGTKELPPDYRTMEQLFPEPEYAKQWGLHHGGTLCSDFDQAAMLYEMLVEAIAPRR